ncbi:MAG TPA: peptide deformylase [Gemmatimonadales bacterium]
MSVLDIHVLGSPVLREVTSPVAQVTDDVRRLIDDMFETMYAANGVGLAAPQVGRRERIAVIDVGEGPIAIVNPEILTSSGSQRGEEGCLSIPEIFADVERAMHVTVRATSVEGEPFEVEGSELFARALQHEIDHLHGKLFLDYLSMLKRRSAMARWEKLKKEFPGNRRVLSAQEIAEHNQRPDEEL